MDPFRNGLISNNETTIFRTKKDAKKEANKDANKEKQKRVFFRVSFQALFPPQVLAHCDT